MSSYILANSYNSCLEEFLKLVDASMHVLCRVIRRLISSISQHATLEASHQALKTQASNLSTQLAERIGGVSHFPVDDHFIAQGADGNVVISNECFSCVD